MRSGIGLQDSAVFYGIYGEKIAKMGNALVSMSTYVVPMTTVNVGIPKKQVFPIPAAG